MRFDQHSNGLSNWDAEDASFNAWLQNLETVTNATGHQRVTILGIFQGCSAAVAYTVRHPECASHLVLYGGYLRKRNHRGSKDVFSQEEAMISFIPSGWGQNNPAFRQIFTSLFVHDGTTKQMDWFNELQRRTQKSINVMG